MGFQAALIALSTLAIFLLIPPFIWHAKSINIPAMTLIVWLLVMDVKIFVDAIIWSRDDLENAWNGEGYCDVMVKLSVGANVGISSSVAGIMFNLYRILKADRVIPELRSKKKIIYDLLISTLTPVLVMGLNYLVQVRRYFILQYSGCQTVLSASYLTIILYTIWMVIWSLVGVIFAIMIIVVFFKKRKDVKDILRCTNSGLNLIKFSKLLIFCIIVILVMFPFSVYIFSDDLGGVSADYDFASAHSPVFWNGILRLNYAQPYFISWIYLSISYVVFIFFGLGSDAVDMYINGLTKIGFKPLVEFVRRKRQLRRQAKADASVSRALNIEHITTGNSENGTAFDIEMQQIMEDDKEGNFDSDRSPTSTAVSNVFADKNEINRHKRFEYLSGFNESMFEGLDEEDLNYINMLYENDMKSSSSRALDSRKLASALNDDAKDEINIEVTTPVSPEDSVTDGNNPDFSFVRKIELQGDKH